MAINIKNKRSSVVNKAPDPGALAAGEIAVNYNANSPALYIEDAGGSVVKIANGVTDLGTANVTTTTLDVTNSTGTDATLPAATTSAAGLLSSADKTKLDLQPATPHWQRTGTTISPSTSGDNLEIGGTAEVDGASTFNAVVENTSGGYKFPDGTVQLTAADPAGQTYSLQQVTTTGNTTTNDIILGSNKIQLTAVTGDITSAGDIQVGGNPNSGTAAGSRVESAGVIKAAGSVDGDSTFEGYVVGTSTPSCKILADGSITSNETLTVLGSVAGVEATISNATIKSKINTGNTQPYFQGQKGNNVVFEASHDGGVLAAGDIKIGGTLPSAPNITLANTGSISANGGLNIGSGSYSGYAATIDGSSGQVFAGQINGKNVSGSADNVANTFAGINSSGTQTFSVKGDGSVTAAGVIQSGGDPLGGGEVGVMVDGPSGGIVSTAATGGNSIFKGFTKNGSVTSQINADGSITAAGTGSFGDGTVSLAKNTGITIDDGIIDLYAASSNAGANNLKIQTDVGGTKVEKFTVKNNGDVATSGGLTTAGTVESTNAAYGFKSSATSFPFTAESTLGNGGKAFFADHTGTGSSSSYLFYGQNSGGEVFSVATNGNLTATGNVQARRARSNTTGDVALSIQPADSTAHYGFRIDQANNNLNLDKVGTGTFLTIENTGNLGIGTTNPLAKLHIGGSTEGIRFGVSGATAKGDVKYTASGSEFLDLSIQGTTTGYGNIRFFTGPTPDERMRLDSSGNLLLGGTLPSAPNIELSANGSISAGDAAFGSNATRLRTYSDSTYSGIYNGLSLASDESIYMGGGSTFFVNNGSSSLTIDGAGNVGVGVAPFTSARVTAPHLVVGDGSNAPGLTLYGASNAQASINFGDSTSGTAAYDGGIVYDFNSQAMSFATNAGAERLRIDSSGNVLVGGTLPSAPNIELSANGSITAANTLFIKSNNKEQISLNTSPSGGVAYLRDNQENILITLNGGNGSGTFSNTITSGSTDFTGPYSYMSPQGIGLNSNASTAQFLVQQSTGNVLIGGTVPAAPNITLASNGAITTAGKIFVDGTNVTAYAFQAVNSSSNRGTYYAENSSGGYVFEGGDGSGSKIFLSGTGAITAAGHVVANDVIQSNATSGGAYAFEAKLNGTSTAIIKADGSITAAGNVIAGGYPNNYAALVAGGGIDIRQDNTSVNCFTVYEGGVTAADISISMKSGGSITTAGDYQAGGNPDNGTAIGTRSNANGSHQACGADDNNVIYEGFVQGSSTPRFKVFAGGNANFYGSITAANVSDIRFKKNIEDANPQLKDVVSLGSQLKNYDWTDDAPLNDELRARRFLGLVAQEAEKVCPELTYTVPRTKQGEQLTPEEVIPAVYEEKIVPAVIGDDGEIIEPETTENVLVTPEQVIPATYEELDDSYKAINHDILVMKLLGAVAELSAKVEALTQA